MKKTTTLFRPIGSRELELIEGSGFSAFPPRLPEQPIFYPVTNESYAIQIAKEWNCRFNEDRKGFVTRFEVETSYVSKFEKKVVGGSEHEELWVPAEELENFNKKIIGKIEVIHNFCAE